MKNDLVWGLLLVLVGIILGIGFVFSVKYLQAEARVRLQWATVPGVVLASSRSGSAFDNRDFVTVRFEYEVGGARYVGEQSWSPGQSWPPSWFEKADSPDFWWQGKPALVYYNPMNPTKGFVRPRTADIWKTSLPYFSLILGLASFGFGIWHLWSHNRPLKNKREIGD